MLGHKSVGSHSIGHKSIGHSGVGHKSQPHSQAPVTMQLKQNPEIVNTFNSSSSHREPIKNYIKKF